MSSIHPSLSNGAFVDEIFQRFLQRPADERGRAFYVMRLEEGASRLDVLSTIVMGDEYFTLLCRQAFGPQTGSAFLRFAPPGHFYSPIPSAQDVEKLAAAPVSLAPDAVPGVDLDVDGQLAWLATLDPYARDLKFSEDPKDAQGSRNQGGADGPDGSDDAPGANGSHGSENARPQTRYFINNQSFAPGDAVWLAALMRHLRPARIVEAGAGLSTAVMLDVAERHLDRRVSIETIDPDPSRLRALLHGNEDGMLTVHERLVQEAPIDLFTSLCANDILFIDSSHVLKLGSDLSFLLFDVLPRLAPGVFVHFHDIAWPFEYPLESFEAGRAWNEAYALHAFLAHNDAFRIVLFADFLMRAHRDAIRRHLPLAMRQPRGIPAAQHTACSLWLVRA